MDDVRGVSDVVKNERSIEECLNGFSGLYIGCRPRYI